MGQGTVVKRVWIAQCLCPQRHCVMASAGEAEDEKEAEETVVEAVRTAIGGMLRHSIQNPWCAICRAPVESWTYEVARSRFASLAEALPELEKAEHGMALAPAMFGDMPRSD